MDIENWSDIAPSFIKVPLNAYKYRHILQKWWKNLLVYTNRGDTNIVVLGRANVGKSVMASYLYGETNNLSWELPETSKDVESNAFTLGNWTNIVRVIPAIPLCSFEKYFVWNKEKVVTKIGGEENYDSFI